MAGLAIVGLSAALLMRGSGIQTHSGESLTAYVAAGMRGPVEQIARDYEQEYGVHVELQFGGSNTLLNQIQVNTFATGDLFLAADDFYTEKAVELGLARETLPIGHQRPVVIVRKDQTKGIKSLADLIREDVTVALPDPDQAAAGLAARRALEAITIDETDRWTQLSEAVTSRGVFKPTVNDVANDVKLGAIDAGVVWDTTVAMPLYRDELEAINVAEFEGDPDLVSLAVLASSQKPTEALRFARYVTARDKGLQVFADAGIRPVEGDVWADHPQINFYCGAVNRRVVEQIIADFQEREGVDVNTIYDGCGILTSRMKTIEKQSPALGFPDFYMACDVYYLDNVREWFEEAANVSDVEIVIAVPKGSTRVQGPEDLVQPGVRVAIGQPEQCTIGALTRRLLEQDGLYAPLIQKQSQPGEVVVEKSSSALLVPDVITGHVDAAVAYITDVLASQDQIDIIRFTSPLKLAIQPLSIARSSDHKYLVRRLYRQIVDSPEAFEAAGFHYRLAKTGPDATEEGGVP
ncbi:MAG: extracellular solute-binding protein [Planctomycetaceae bacterium]|nr:extracellular solute-binding protein [Planctomycetaceae bacterium]